MGTSPVTPAIPPSNATLAWVATDPSQAAALILAEADYLMTAASWSRMLAGAPSTVANPACRDISPFGR